MPKIKTQAETHMKRRCRPRAVVPVEPGRRSSPSRAHSATHVSRYSFYLLEAAIPTRRRRRRSRRRVRYAMWHMDAICSTLQAFPRDRLKCIERAESKPCGVHFYNKQTTAMSNVNHLLQTSVCEECGRYLSYTVN